MTINEQLILITAISFFMIATVALIVMLRQLVRVLRNARLDRIADAVTRDLDNSPVDIVDVARVLADDHLIEALRMNIPISDDDRDTLVRLLELLRDDARRETND